MEGILLALHICDSCIPEISIQLLFFLYFVFYFNLCKKASQKLNALAIIAPYMCLEKLKTVMKAYITSQFGYCTFVWMF